MKLEYYQQIFGKSSNIKFRAKPFQWEPCFSMGTDRQTWRS